MGRAVPVSAGLVAIRVAKRNVDTGKLFVLQEVADDASQSDVGADRELADAIRVSVLRHVLADLAGQHGVGRVDRNQSPVLDDQPHRWVQHLVLVGEPIAELFGRDDSLDRKRTCKRLAFGQVAPASRLPIPSVARYPSHRGGERRLQLRPERRAHRDPRGDANDFEDLPGHAVDLLVIRGHAILHQDFIDPDHVPVAAAQLFDEELAHGLAKRELTLQPGADEIGDGGPESTYVVRDRARERGRRPFDVILHRDRSHGRARRKRLLLDRLGDVHTRLVADDVDPVLRADVEAGAHGVASARSELGPHRDQIFSFGSTAVFVTSTSTRATASVTLSGAPSSRHLSITRSAPRSRLPSFKSSRPISSTLTPAVSTPSLHSTTASPSSSLTLSVNGWICSHTPTARVSRCFSGWLAASSGLMRPRRTCSAGHEWSCEMSFAKLLRKR